MKSLETATYEQSEAPHYSIRDFLTVLFKRKYMILFLFLLIAAITAYVIFTLPQLYEAKSTVLLKMGREYVNRPPVGEGGGVASVSPGEITNSEIQILTSHNSIRKVIETIGLKNIYPEIAKNPPPGADPVEAAAVEFEKGLTVQEIKRSSVLQVSFQHKNPKIAAQAVNTLIDIFREKHLQVLSDPKSSFLEKQLASYEQKLKDSEFSLQSYKQKKGVFSIEEQRTLLLKQRADIDWALKTTDNSMTELKDRIPSLKNQLKMISAKARNFALTDRDRIIDDAKAKMLSMQLEEKQLLKKYTENNPLVVGFRNDMQLVQNFVKEQQEEVTDRAKTGNAAYQTTQMELLKAESDFTSQKARAASLRQQLRQVEQEIQSLDLSEKDIQELKRQQAINEKNFQIYATKAEEARISENMDRLKLANVSVIEEATPALEPVKSKKSQYLIMGIVLAVFGSLGAAFFSEYAAQSFSTPEAVERRLGLPVLATVSHQEG